MSKDKYKLRNWQHYNLGLKQRGSLTLWICNDVLARWRYQGKQQRGGQKLYSDLAIETCLTVRLVYHLALRQTEGFVGSLFARLKVELSIPDYTTLCRRAQALPVRLKATAQHDHIHVVVDATGLKVYGEGEWKVRKYGWCKHRTWMKLHVALNAEDQQAEAVELSTNAADDAAEVPCLLQQIQAPISSFTGDGAYDKDKVRRLLWQRAEEQGEDILEVIAPQHNAIKDTEGRQYMKQRDEDLSVIKCLGRKHWKVLSHYHQRSKAETFMYRYKVIVGGSLRARKFDTQQTEVRLGCKVLNQMLQTAKPVSEKAA